MADLMQPNPMMPAMNGFAMPPAGGEVEPPGGEMESLAYEAGEPDMQTESERLLTQLEQMAAMDNVAKTLNEEKRKALGEAVKREYEIDNASRSDWEAATRDAIKRSKQFKERKTFPWAGASNVNFPIITTAALQFAARAYPAIFDGPRIVKSMVQGADPAGQKAAQADRVSQHMSWQFMRQQTEWESDFDSLLHRLPIEGCMFRKTYRDPTSRTGWRSDLVSAVDVVVNQSAKSIETAPRITHKYTLYPHEIEQRKRAGRFLDIDLKLSASAGADSQAPESFLEQHRLFDIDDDGLQEPWIVTIHEATGEVVRVTAGYETNEALFDEINDRLIELPRGRMWTKYDFLPDPEGGFYGVGFGVLLESMTSVINTAINQMMDAGTLQNAGGGFIGSGLDLGRGKSKIALAPGEYRVVSSTGANIRDSIVNMQHPGPSSVLFQLLSLFIDAAKDIAAIQDILVGDLPRNQTATATMAMIEQGLKVYTAIIKRILRSLKGEFEIVFAINKKHLNRIEYVQLLDVPVQVTQADYQGEMDIAPIADPKMGTDMQRMAKVQFMLERQQSPFVNGFEVERRAWETFGIDDLQSLLKPPQPDPMQQAAMSMQMEGMAADVQTKKAGAVKATVEAQHAVTASDQDRFRSEVDGELSQIIDGETGTASDANVNEMGQLAQQQPPPGVPLQ